jgi:putative transposase
VKKNRLTQAQMAVALKQAKTGTKIDEICRKMGISDATFYKWRQKYGG